MFKNKRNLHHKVTYICVYVREMQNWNFKQLIRSQYKINIHACIHSLFSCSQGKYRTRKKMGLWSLQYEVSQNFLLQESKAMLIMPPNCKLTPGQVYFKRCCFTWKHFFSFLFLISTWQVKKNAWEMLEAKKNNETPKR